MAHATKLPQRDTQANRENSWQASLRCIDWVRSSCTEKSQGRSRPCVSPCFPSVLLVNSLFTLSNLLLDHYSLYLISSDWNDTKACVGSLHCRAFTVSHSEVSASCMDLHRPISATFSRYVSYFCLMNVYILCFTWLQWKGCFHPESIVVCVIVCYCCTPMNCLFGFLCRVLCNRPEAPLHKLYKELD